VAKWADRMRGIDLDLWAALIPFEETRIYVSRVLSNLSRYAYREGGESLVPAIDLQPPKSAKLESSAF
jgi:soluble lytic murein transglycosylase